MKNKRLAVDGLWKAGLLAAFLLSTFALADFSSSLRNAQGYYPSAAGSQGGNDYNSLSPDEKKAFEAPIASAEIANSVNKANQYQKFGKALNDDVDAQTQNAQNRLQAVHGKEDDLIAGLRRMSAPSFNGARMFTQAVQNQNALPECGPNLQQQAQSIQQSVGQVGSDLSSKSKNASYDLKEKQAKQDDKLAQWNAQVYSSIQPYTSENPAVVQEKVKAAVLKTASALASGDYKQVVEEMKKITKDRLDYWQAARALWVKRIHGPGGVFDMNREALKNENQLADAITGFGKSIEPLNFSFAQIQQMNRQNQQLCLQNRAQAQQWISKVESGMQTEVNAGPNVILSAGKAGSEISDLKARLAGVHCQNTDPSQVLYAASNKMKTDVDNAKSVVELQNAVTDGERAVDQAFMQAARIQSQPYNSLKDCSVAVNLVKEIQQNKDLKKAYDIGKDGRPDSQIIPELMQQSFGGGAGGAMAGTMGGQAPMPINIPSAPQQVRT